MSDEKSQLDKFKEAARELECDDDPEAFKKRLGKIASKPRATNRDNETDSPA